MAKKKGPTKYELLGIKPPRELNKDGSIKEKDK